MSSRSKIMRMLRALGQRSDCVLIMLVLVLSALLILHYGGTTPGVNVEPGQVLYHEPEETEPELSDDIPKAGPPVRFLMYNVQNYFVPGEKSRSRYVSRSKSVKSRNAVAEVIASAAPEIVGLIEIGGEKALADLRERLAEHGLNYPYSYVLERRGEDRALAILSVHPIVQNDSVADMALQGQKNRKMLRGILDVTVELKDGRRFCIIGAHLKSRVATDAGAAEHLRSREARTLAVYLNEKMKRNPALPVLVYGDWNDGPSDLSLGVLTRGISKKSALTRLQPLDTRGHGWTIYYEEGKDYFVFDQIFVNNELRRRRGRRSNCGIVDCPATAIGSDHRPVWCELR
ncbi:MAG: endonuclease/exonuclease/phosphatase family protein [Akkermansia sp.]|nr:endonuclease/exonuclease/phosphatase family protein [Akkermansia sp.]